MKHLATLNHYFWKYRTRFFLGIVFIILTNYFRILAPQLTGYIVNTVVAALDHQPAHQVHGLAEMDGLVQWIIQHLTLLPASDRIFWSGLLLLILALISGFFMFLMRQTIIVMSRLIEYDQKNEVFTHYQKLDAGFYKQYSTGDLMNRIAEDVSRVRMYTGPAIMYFINLAAVLGFSIFFMFRTNVKLTLVALAPLPLLAVTIYFVNNLIERKSERIQALLSDLTTNAQEAYSGIRVIKSFVQEKAMLGFFTRNSQLYKEQALGLARMEAIFFPAMALMIGVSTLLTIMVGALDVIHQVPGTSVGTIAEFVLYIQMLTFPVSAIGWTASMTQRAAASQKRLNEFLQTQSKIIDDPASGKPEIQGAIELNQVNFTYANTGLQAIQQFTCSIRPGERIAIVGKTGSGKTTLAQLLLRMYDPQSGNIQLDGIPVQQIQLQHLRSHIGYVPQDVFLFSDTVANNIRFGLTGVTQEAVEEAARKAAIHHEIAQFPDRYETLVGERGVTLSGGQKQRISIARALIRNPRLVILDDCLSAVDAKTENEILSNLQTYLTGKTAIIITHRIFALFDFDRILVLENGQIAESGTHDELLKKNGIYAGMYALQQQQDASREPANG